MKSYLQLLEEKSAESGIPLLQAFKSAGVPTSTFYRTINGKTELRHETAKKAMKALEKLHALQQAREYTERLRSNGERPRIGTVRAKFKPRSTGA